MKHESEEILTALLDGQLSAEEESRLRSRLRSEAGLQELFEQLQTQRELLQQLPGIKASGDFASRVAAELLERKVELSLPPEEGNSVLRGSWQSAAVIAASLAALLLVAIFLWPRSIATDSPQVARFENTEGTRKQEARERANLEQQQMVETRPIQRAPSGPLPKPAELADGMRADSAGVLGGRAAGSLAPSSGRAAGLAGEEKSAKAALGGLAAAAGIEGGGDAGSPELNMPALRSEASPKLAIEGGNSADPLARGTEGLMAAGADSAARGSREEEAVDAIAEGGMSSGAGAGGWAGELAETEPVEVWFVEAVSEAAPAAEPAQAGKSQAASDCELFLAEVTADQLPDWLSRLKSEATVTQLDGSESGELLGQLRENLKGQSDNRPMSAAGLEGDSTSKELRRSSREQSVKDPEAESGAAAAAAAAPAAPQVAINFLGHQPADKIQELLVRSQQRQQAVQRSAPQAAPGFDGGGSGAKKTKRDAAEDRSGAEGYLNQLRSEADRQAKPAQLPGASRVPVGTGKRIVIVVRGK